MEYDSVLDQQSISGKSVSLILCVEAGLYEIRSHIHLNEYETNHISAILRFYRKAVVLYTHISFAIEKFVIV